MLDDLELKLNIFNQWFLKSHPNLQSLSINAYFVQLICQHYFISMAIFDLFAVDHGERYTVILLIPFVWNINTFQITILVAQSELNALLLSLKAVQLSLYLCAFSNQLWIQNSLEDKLKNFSSRIPSISNMQVKICCTAAAVPINLCTHFRTESHDSEAIQTNTAIKLTSRSYVVVYPTHNNKMTRASNYSCEHTFVYMETYSEKQPPQCNIFSSKTTNWE